MLGKFRTKATTYGSVEGCKVQKDLRNTLSQTMPKHKREIHSVLGTVPASRTGVRKAREN